MKPKKLIHIHYIPQLLFMVPVIWSMFITGTTLLVDGGWTAQ